MRVAIFGASGMVGSGVLRECLEDARVRSVLVVGRSRCGVAHPKVQEVLHQDFFDYGALKDRLAGLDACFFCLGVSAARMDEAAYRRLTYDLTLAAARALLAASPRITFCYVSGRGTDSTGRGRMMWARVKGQTENALLALPFRAVYMLRPGIIEPLKGVRSKTRLYQAFYTAARPVFPLLRLVLGDALTTTVAVGRAMIRLALQGDARRVLETRDINRLAAAG